VSADYAVLAPIYASLGMADFAESMTPRLIDYAQRNDWLGRRILDLGCGTGAALAWLTRRNYVAVGIDSSPQMLELCRQRLDDLQLQYDVRQGDLRNIGSEIGTMDLVLALDVVNELNSLRDLETLFVNVYKILADEKLFIFDMHTIQGLCQQGQIGDQMIYNQADLAVMTTNSYDFERQIHERQFLIFHRQGDVWQRSEGVRILRGYPAQAIVALLQRCGFQAVKVVTTNFGDFEPGISSTNRVLMLAQKH
jgi:SAM-dependent methyltransferase